MRACVLLMALACAALPADAAEPPARQLFGAISAPAALSPAAIGSYARGCLAGGAALPLDGPAWQAMRLSRNRNWGHPALVAFIERLAVAAQGDGWPGLLVGDMAQPRGGPMRTGHASHQIGLDVDLWLTPMPDHRLTSDERETLSAVSMLREGTRTVDPTRFTDLQVAVIRRAALDPEVARIFVHPGIKQAMCERVAGVRDWLGKVRPWWGHDTHFHVRLRCPPGAGTCKDQEPPPPGDGCGDDLAWWLTDEPWRPAPPGPRKPPLTLADLPGECRAVLRTR
ncbi:MAG: penicillin-insensitive murein endopeptidase [Geminicoccaceae bacterium]